MHSSMVNHFYLVTVVVNAVWFLFNNGAEWHKTGTLPFAQCVICVGWMEWQLCFKKAHFFSEFWAIKNMLEIWFEFGGVFRSGCWSKPINSISPIHICICMCLDHIIVLVSYFPFFTKHILLWNVVMNTATTSPWRDVSCVICCSFAKAVNVFSHFLALISKFYTFAIQILGPQHTELPTLKPFLYRYGDMDMLRNISPLSYFFPPYGFSIGKLNDLSVKKVHLCFASVSIQNAIYW